VDDLDLGYLMAVAGSLVWTPRAQRATLDAFGAPQLLIAWARDGGDPPPDGMEPLGREAVARLAAIDEEAVQHALADLARCGARALVCSDPAYPAALRDLCDPPPVLYARGDPGAASGRAVAIVGSRAATSYGRRIASQMASDFGAFGACIVSGLARGIDAAAHKGALQARGRTAAVIGSGLAALYPPYHGLLAEEIVEAGGVVLSEFPPSLHAMAHHFPMRNRIVAALAQATVVVEAGARSGALITARLADELGRQVFAVPGDVGRATSAGTNGLIKDGVPLISDAADAAQLLGWRIAVEHAPDDDAADPLAALIAGGLVTIEELRERTGIDVATLAARLTMLELGGLVERLPGGSFATVKRSRS
jgi:DNA processing protein